MDKKQLKFKSVSKTEVSESFIKKVVEMIGDDLSNVMFFVKNNVYGAISKNNNAYTIVGCEKCVSGIDDSDNFTSLLHLTAADSNHSVLKNTIVCKYCGNILFRGMGV